MFDHASKLSTTSATERALNAIDWKNLANYTRARADKRKSEAHMAHWLALKAAYTRQLEARVAARQAARQAGK